MENIDPFHKLRPQAATPEAELCRCLELRSVMLQSHGSSNPIACLSCGLEVAPERVGFTADLVDQVANWCAFYDAFFELWLDSGEFELWARTQLEELSSPVNRRGMKVAREIDSIRRCYYWLFQDTGADEFSALTKCQKCGAKLSQIGRWSGCEGCAIIIAN